MRIDRARSAIRRALTAKTWGFYDVAFKGKPFEFERPFGSYVMENVLFKISFPAEFHAQTAVECAMQLHPQVAGRLDQIETHRDRDAGSRRAHHRQDRSAGELRRSRPLHPVHGGRAADLRPADGRAITRTRSPPIRASMRCARKMDGQRESAVHARTISIRTSATSATRCRCSSRTAPRREKVSIDYPIGHRKRRAEGIPVLSKSSRRRCAGICRPPRSTESWNWQPIRPLWTKCPSISS